MRDTYYEYEELNEYVPERALWLSVIERAMMDFCFPTHDLSIAHSRDLKWFFFEDKPEPYNLTYICQNLFDDDGSRELIRKRVKTIKASPESRIKFENSRFRISALCAFQRETMPVMPRKEPCRPQPVQQPLQVPERRGRSRLRRVILLPQELINGEL